jgi:hypothetical protein
MRAGIRSIPKRARTLVRPRRLGLAPAECRAWLRHCDAFVGMPVGITPMQITP